MVLNLIDDCDLIHGDIRDLIVFVSKKEYAILNVDHVSLERRVRAAGHVDLFAHQLL